MPDASNTESEGIWRQLRRRKVVQWGIGYAAAAWGFLQALEYVSEAFEWPGYIRQVAIFVAMVGLPIAMVLAWYHGDRGRQRVSGTEVTTIVLLAAAGALFVVAATSAWLSARSRLSGETLLAEARFSTLTDFDGIEQAGAITRDGKFAAFLSDRDGPMDVWVTQIGTGEFHNLTRGEFPEVFNDEIRNLGFSPDGTQVDFWSRTQGPTANERRIGIWSVATMGGAPREYLPGVVELAWSNAGSRLAYHTPAPGDPLYVADAVTQEGRQVYAAAEGMHCHFPVWSPDDEHIYFVSGKPPDHLDVWRMRPDGSDPERLTFHDSRVAYPVFIDRNRVLYLATAADGSGPWLHLLDVRRRESRRLVTGPDRYESLAASADGQRLLVTVARPRSTLWRVSLDGDIARASAAARIALPTSGGRSPRYGPGYLLYIASKRGQDGIWKLSGEVATELWSRPATRLAGAPAISPDGLQVAFTAERNGESRLHLMGADGSSPRQVAPTLEVRGTPSWAHDSRSLAVEVIRDGQPAIFRVPVDGDAPEPMVNHYSTGPQWSPTGEFLVYGGPTVGLTLELHAVTPNGKPYRLPKLTLTHGAERVAFRQDGHAIVMLQGKIGNRDLVLVELESGSEHRLSDLGGEVTVADFDLSPDGREMTLERRVESADQLLIERGSD